MLGRHASWGLPNRSSEQVPAGEPYSTIENGETIDRETNPEMNPERALKFWLCQAKKLGPKQHEIFLSAENSKDYDNYVSELKTSIHRGARDSKLSRLSRKIKPIYQLASSIAPILNSASQINPMPASLVLGGITCILSLTTRLDDFQTRVLETLDWMSDELELVNQYSSETIFEGDPSVKACEIILAADILKFCIEVAEFFYDESGAGKSSMMLALKGLCKDFDARFGDVKTNFKLHIGALEKRRDLINARRAKSLHSEVENIGQLLRHEHDDRNIKDKADIESEMNLRNEERRRRFLEWLPSLNFGEIQENNFERRVTDSGTWLLDHPEFQAWKQSSQSTLLWVHGKPGTGKSHLAARIINELGPNGSAGGDTALAYAYCTTTQTKTRMTLNSILGTILSQLYKKLPLSSGIETLLARADTASKEEPQRSEMKEGIKMVASRLSSAFIIVDGLDECNQLPDRQFEDFCAFLASLGKLKDSGSSTRVLVFSRPDYKEISRSFVAFAKVQVDNGANDDDIKAYISQKVDEINTDPSPEERQGFEDVKQLMFNSASGLFLWVHFKAKYFKEIGCVDDIKDALQDVTEGLDDLYGEEIKKILNHPSRFVRDRALRALLWVTNSYRPLSKVELLEALSVKPGRSSINQCQRLSKDISISTECADLINEVNGVYQLRHASLKDFPSSQLPVLLSYSSLQGQSHASLAETCLTYINFQGLNSVILDSPNGLTELKAQYPLLDYAANFWGDHFLEGDCTKNNALHQLLSSFLSKEAAMRVTIQILEFKAFSDDLWCLGNPTPLHVLAIFNLVETANIMPHLTDFIDSQDEFNHAPIEYSVLYRRRSMTRWLLDKHVTDHRSGHPFHPGVFESCNRWLLHSAAEENWDDIVEDLVNLGFEPNVCDRLGESPVHAAAKAGANRSLESLLKLGASADNVSQELHTPLTLAAFHMNLAGVNILLGAGAEVNKPGKSQETALHHAAQCGHRDMATSLLDHGANCNSVCSVDSNFYGQGQTPLHYATRANKPEMVELLIEHGADMESETSYGDTAVLLACYLDETKVLEILIKNGANIFTWNKTNKSTGLHISAGRGNLPLIDVILASDAHGSLVNETDKNGNTPLLVALYEGNSSAAEILLKRGARPETANANKSTPLHVAIDNGCSEVARMLLTDYMANPKTLGFRGKTALHHIAARGLGDLLPFVIETGKPDDLRDQDGFTPLHHAAAYNRHDFISDLVALNPEIRICVKAVHDLTPLHVAARNGAVETVKLFTKLDPSSRQLQDRMSRLPLHMAALFGHTRCVELLSTPETTDSQDINGVTPLWLAAKEGHRATVQYLIEQGANVNQVNKTGLSPAFAALGNHHLAIVNLLLDHGSNVDTVDDHGVTLFHLSAGTGDRRLVERISQSIRASDTPQGCRLLTVDNDGWDAMCHAAEGGNASIIDIFSELQFPIDGLGHSLFSPLSQAASHGYADFVKRALSKGARLRNMEDHVWDRRLQRDALIHATVHRNTETIKVLLAGGSDPTEKDSYGQCAIDYARRHFGQARIFDSWLQAYAPLEPTLLARKQRIVVTDFAEEAMSQYTEKDRIWGQRYRQLTGLSIGLMLLNTDDSLAQARLCKIELAEIYLKGWFICDGCQQHISAPSYSCSVCEDVDLCHACYHDYCCSDPPKTVPEHIRSLWNIEDEVYPVLRVAETFRTHGAELLPHCLMPITEVAEEWMRGKMLAYAHWAKSLKSQTKRTSETILGWRFVNLLNEIRSLNPDHLERKEDSTKFEALHDQLIHIQKELGVIFALFNPRREPMRFTCNGHSFLQILPHSDLSASDKRHFDADGKLNKDFFLSLVAEYSDSTSDNRDDNLSQSSNPGQIIPTGEEGSSTELPKSSDEIPAIAKERLELIRNRLVTDSGGIDSDYLLHGKKSSLDVSVNMQDISWNLAHAMLGIPSAGSLAGGLDLN